MQKRQFQMLERCSEMVLLLLNMGLQFTYCRHRFVVIGKDRKPTFRRHQSMFDSHRDIPTEMSELVTCTNKKEVKKRMAYASQDAVKPVQDLVRNCRHDHCRMRLEAVLGWKRTRIYGFKYYLRLLKLENEWSRMVGEVRIEKLHRLREVDAGRQSSDGIQAKHQVMNF